eukprot:scaffold155415_cov21-Tisochrysis_lutea.AAC.1
MMCICTNVVPFGDGQSVPAMPPNTGQPSRQYPRCAEQTKMMLAHTCAPELCMCILDLISKPVGTFPANLRLKQWGAYKAKGKRDWQQQLGLLKNWVTQPRNWDQCKLKSDAFPV